MAHTASDFFPQATLYPSRTMREYREVRETSGRAKRFPWTERHLQCLWFDPQIRPTGLTTDNGERIIIDDPGIWNLEAGPDFIGAAFHIEPGNRHMSGDVEIHIHPDDWKKHRHASDPRYAQVRLHVTYFPGAPVPNSLPPGALHVPLRDALAANPVFDFDAIDTTAYPYAVRATHTPCFSILNQWNTDQREDLLIAAGEERLRRKTERMAAAIEAKGVEQVVYEEVMCALGYKHNKAPFRFLAETVPFTELREKAGNDPLAAYAILAGVADLLPRKTKPSWDTETLQFIRALWNIWWKESNSWDGKLIPRESWQTAGLRPANAPARRLMAAAYLFTREETLSTQWINLAVSEPERCVARIIQDLTAPSGTYWDYRLSLTGRKQGKPIALIGKSRAEAIVNNVLIPFLAANRTAAPFQAEILKQLPAEADNGIIRQTAHALFGPDHPPPL